VETKKAGLGGGGGLTDKREPSLHGNGPPHGHLPDKKEGRPGEARCGVHSSVAHRSIMIVVTSIWRQNHGMLRNLSLVRCVRACVSSTDDVILKTLVTVCGKAGSQLSPQLVLWKGSNCHHSIIIDTRKSCNGRFVPRSFLPVAAHHGEADGRKERGERRE
jgi:hypothetical protein